MLSVVVLLINAACVSAAETESEYEVQVDYLKSIGTPDELLEQYTPERIKNLYDTLQERVVGDKTVQFSGYKVEEYDVTDSDNRIRGNISTDDLRLIIATYDFLTDDNYVDGVNVSLSYEWLNDPVCHYEDGFGFSWDGSIFNDEGIYAASYYTHPDYGVFTMDEVDRAANANVGSMYWYLDTGKPKGVTSNNFGGADIYLVPKEAFPASERLKSKMYFQYVHQKLGANISLGFSTDSTGNFSVSVEAGHYDMQTESYTYHE